MAASFYASPLIGATTTLACFAHEIPHEIADYSILIRSGFTKRQAMQSQFITAVGAFVSHFCFASLCRCEGLARVNGVFGIQFRENGILIDIAVVAVVVCACEWIRSGKVFRLQLAWTNEH